MEALLAPVSPVWEARVDLGRNLAAVVAFRQGAGERAGRDKEVREAEEEVGFHLGREAVARLAPLALTG